MSKLYMGIDQYGNYYHGLKHPRKDLMEKIGCQHAQKQYTETVNGKNFHTGYVIAGKWITVFEVKQMRKEIL